MTVDGGTNRWINYLSQDKVEKLLLGESNEFLPTLVTGMPERYYKNKI